MGNKNEISNFVTDELEAIGKEFLGQGFYFRLIMTDDISNLHLIRQRAKDKVEVAGDNKFYYGCSLGPVMQKRIDDLVRNHKKALIALCVADDETQKECGIETSYDKEQRAHMVLITNCGMGFFVTEHKHVPREERQQRKTMAGLTSRVDAMKAEQAIGQKDRHVTRRNFVNLATVNQR